MSRAYIIGEQKGKAPVVDYNEVNILETDDAKRAKLEYWIAKRVGEALVGAYPKRQWEVRVGIDQGVCVVVCPSVSLTKGYHIYLNKSMNDLIAAAKRAGGEILERHNVTRGRNVDVDAIDVLPRTVRDDVISVDARPDPIAKVKHV